MKNYFGKSRPSRTKSFNKRRSSDSVRPSMHKATCGNCGKECEVPFKPTSGKPIYCSSCFDRTENEAPKRFNKERGDRKFKGGDSRKRSFDDRDSVMHNAVCDKCGAACEVPFRPTKGKPIYCDKCFGNKEQDFDQLKKEFGVLNKKLDDILEILTQVLSANNDHEDFEKEEPEEPKLTQKTKKKMVIKKGVGKKSEPE